MGYQRRVHGEFYFELYSIIMRNLIALCVASMVGVSTANYYIGHQPMRYHVPQHMYVSQPQVANLNLDYSVAVPGHQQMHMPVRYYVPSAMSGHQHMYVPQPQVVNLDLDYRPSVAFPGQPTAAFHDYITKPVFGSRSGSVTNVDTCQASKELAKDAVQANLNVLETISKAILIQPQCKISLDKMDFSLDMEVAVVLVKSSVVDHLLLKQLVIASILLVMVLALIQLLVV